MRRSKPSDQFTGGLLAPPVVQSSPSGEASASSGASCPVRASASDLGVTSLPGAKASGVTPWVAPMGSTTTHRKGSSPSLRVVSPG